MIVGIIGVGRFAGFVVEGLQRSGDAPLIVLSPRNRERSQRLATRPGTSVANDNSDVVTRSDVVILSVTPGCGEEAVRGLPWRSDQVVISAVSNFRLDALAHEVSPAQAVRAMIVSSAALGAGAISQHPANGPAHDVLSRLGSVTVFDDEMQFEAASCLGAYFGWLLALCGQTEQWLRKTGVDSAAARTLVAETFRGAAVLLATNRDHPLAEMVGELETPGGNTAMGRGILERRRALATWDDALSAVLARKLGS
jgi:pyrroline-5-carboxylate reductase